MENSEKEEKNMRKELVKIICIMAGSIGILGVFLFITFGGMDGYIKHLFGDKVVYQSSKELSRN